MLGEDHTRYQHPPVVQTIRTGKPGRPRKVIDPAILNEAFRRDRNIKAQEFAMPLELDGTSWAEP
ncbi:hypothetical protein FRC01_005930 [Tulasnella sp. 417]|nr:hypothetical protein FRC01_005930 [Tulasnella sp. 417]